MRPLRDLVLILPDERQSKKGLIHIPDVAQEPAMTGTVTAIGHDCQVHETRYSFRRKKDVPFTPHVKMVATPGMRVAYIRQDAKLCILEDGERYAIISVRGIHGEIRKADDGSREFAPFFDRLLVKVDAPEDKSAGGIIIPDKARKRSSYGTIIALGKVKLDGSQADDDFSKGDRIAFFQGDGHLIQLDGQEHRLLDREQVLATMHPQ